MNGVKLACGCAFVAVAMAGQLSHWSGSDLAAWRSAATTFAGSRVSAATVQPAAHEVATIPPSSLQGGGFGVEVIPPDRYGQFDTAVEIEGQRLSVLVDTGASYVILSFEDADRLGFRPLPADYKYRFWTANGWTYEARIQLHAIRLGQIEVNDVTAFVGARGALFKSLLGMSFLTRLGGFRVEDGRLVLRQ